MTTRVATKDLHKGDVINIGSDTKPDWRTVMGKSPEKHGTIPGYRVDLSHPVLSSAPKWMMADKKWETQMDTNVTKAPASQSDEPRTEAQQAVVDVPPEDVTLRLTSPWGVGIFCKVTLVFSLSLENPFVDVKPEDSPYTVSVLAEDIAWAEFDDTYDDPAYADIAELDVEKQLRAVQDDLAAEQDLRAGNLAQIRTLDETVVELTRRNAELEATNAELREFVERLEIREGKWIESAREDAQKINSLTAERDEARAAALKFTEFASHWRAIMALVAPEATAPESAALYRVTNGVKP